MNVKIKTKEESKEFIMEKGYNYFPDLFIHKDNKDEIQHFITQYPSPLYIIRDGKRPQSDYFFFTTFEECLTYLDRYEDIFIIAVSVNAYKKNKIILGTIELKSDNMVSFIGSTDPNCDHRTIYNESEYNLHCDIFDKKLNEIPGFDNIYSFLVEENLFDVIVEFTIYDIEVGQNHEKLVIQEIRNY